MRDGRLAEAELAAREALRGQLEAFGRYSGQTVEGLGALTEILSEQGRFQEAEQLARERVDIHLRMGVQSDSVTLANARRSLADTFVGQQRWPDALALYDTIERALAANPGGLHTVRQANLHWAMALIRAGRVRDAVERLQPIAAGLRQTLGADNYATVEVIGMLAAALAATGDVATARQTFEQVAPQLLRPPLDSAVGRRFRRDFILETYLQLHADRAAEGEPSAAAEAFRIADALHSGQVQRALAASAARAAVGDPQLADLARREQDARRQIAALQILVVQAAGAREGSDTPLTGEAMQTLRQLEGAREALLAEINRRFPDYGALIDPQPARVEDVRTVLAADEAVLTMYTTDSRTYVWAVSHAGPVAFATTALSRLDLLHRVTTLRQALDLHATTLGDIPDFDLQTAYGLYAKVLQPVEAGWKGAHTLIVVPHGALAWLPLSLLPTAPSVLPPERDLLFANYQGVPWLARRHAVAVVPSVASLITLRRTTQPAGHRRPFVGFGDPVFQSGAPATTPVAAASGRQVASAEEWTRVTARAAPVTVRSAPDTRGLDSVDVAWLPRLPETAEELQRIAEALGADPAQDVYLGVHANEETVKTLSASGQLATYRVIAFATHGLVPGDLNGLVQPALALSHPQTAGISGDGLLTMEEILGLTTHADWVVLSACNTAAGDGAGAAALSGLGRAFFYAGTRALLASHWPVHSQATTALITALFHRQAAAPGLTHTEAHRQAMLVVLDAGTFTDDAGRPVFSYAHPLFWAPFSVVGDGGRSSVK